MIADLAMVEGAVMLVVLVTEAVPAMAVAPVTEAVLVMAVAPVTATVLVMAPQVADLEDQGGVHTDRQHRRRQRGMVHRRSRLPPPALVPSKLPLGSNRQPPLTVSSSVAHPGKAMVDLDTASLAAVPGTALRVLAMVVIPVMGLRVVATVVVPVMAPRVVAMVVRVTVCRADTALATVRVATTTTTEVGETRVVVSIR